MALNNDNLKISEGTDNDEHIDKKTNTNIEDLFNTKQREEAEDFEIYNKSLFLDNQPEKGNTKNLEQDFIDSDLEDEAWTTSCNTTSNKEKSNNNETSKDEKKESIARLSTKVSKFIGILLIF
jgi:hypothetical protein